jgi:hypothetical protein
MSSTTSRKRSRIAHFQAPFIVAVAAPAALGLACGGKTDVDPDTVGQAGNGPIYNPPPYEPPEYNPLAPGVECQDGQILAGVDGCGGATCVAGRWAHYGVACNPPALSDCPTVEPAIGSACGEYSGDLTCSYAFCYEAKLPTRRCSAVTGLWEAVPLPSCNPPAPSSCSPDMPTAGSDCIFEGEQCYYPGCEGPTSSTATCRYGQWAVVYSIGPACNPPPVVPVCPERDLVSDSSCWYDGQVCPTPNACGPGGSGAAHVCTNGVWTTIPLPCSGTADAGVDAGN